MIVCLISMSAFAQSGDTKKLLEDRLREFAEAYTTIITHKNKQKVLQFFAKDATSNIFVFNISGRSRVQNSDIAGFENYLDPVSVITDMGNSMWKCTLCEKDPFNLKTNATRHVNNVHFSSAPVKCPVCKKHFKNTHSAQYHLKIKHQLRLSTSELSTYSK